MPRWPVKLTNVLRIAVPAALSAVIAGCGTAEYNALVLSRTNNLRTSAPFRVLYGPTRLPGTPISLRVPLSFRKSYTEDSPHGDDGPKIRPDRFQPPFLQIPGMKICYEGMANVGAAGKIPFTCYLAAVPAKPGDADKLAADLLEKLQQTFKDAPKEWQNIDAVAPDGKAQPWKKVRVVGDQPFPANSGRIADGKKVTTEVMPGIFELWLYDAQDYIVLIGWRAPTAADGASSGQEVGLAALINRPSADKVDLANLPILTAGSLTIDRSADGAAAEAPQQ
ncbi:MAG TPA: hypothetical protein VHV08_12955 [Pirellulales bacterium]|nr:hypothetical protein [Pirellulales bacterium]